MGPDCRLHDRPLSAQPRTAQFGRLISPSPLQAWSAKGGDATFINALVFQATSALSRGRGVSSVFALPPYQEGLQVKAQGATQGLPMRGVPDTIVIGGTGAVAPLWAGFIARINATMARRARFINPILYSLDSPSGFHRDELRIYLKDVRGEWNISNSSR